ncbi:MAG TPA: glycosyltransferase family A protein [Thermoanaerobaculia bacterium]|jgi:glycosyltransferase involved in cell wall biosynthesis
MTPLFSIILPTYNRAYVLWRAIQSVLAQTEARWELLVVDDGSTDGTRRLLEEFPDPRIRAVATPNRGPSAARNLGGRLSHAPYLAYLDSDNTWRPEFLATMLDAIDRHPAGVLWYCGQHTTIWRRAATGAWTVEQRHDDLRAQYTMDEALRLKSPDTNCLVHRRPLLAEIGGWDEACRWLEDWDFFTRCLIRYPTSVHWVPQVLVEYRQVHGPGADGVCATTVQDPARNRAGWQYLVEKWRLHPGFAATAQRLAAKHLREISNQDGLGSEHSPKEVTAAAE